MIVKNIEKAETIWKEFPRNIDDRMNAVLSSVNTEFKSAVLGCFMDETWKTADDIKQIADEYAAPHKAPSTSSFRGYCVNTFIPRGIAEEKVEQKGIKPISYFRLTEEGEKYGKPLAQFFLKAAVDTGLSMQKVLGVTGSRGETRSPMNAAIILAELDKEDNLRLIDLQNRTGLKLGILNDHMIKFSKIGFVDYESLSTEERGQVKLKWTGRNIEDIKDVDRCNLLTRKVAKKMQMLEISDYHTVAENLKKPKTDVSRVLSYLEQQEFVARISDLSFGKKSNVLIKEKGRKFLNNCINPAKQALKYDDFDIIYAEIGVFSDKTVSCRYIQEGFGLYRKVSPAYKKEGKETNKGKIMQMLRGQQLRKREIDEMLGKNSTTYIKELCDNGGIEKWKKGKAVFYSSND